MGCLSWWWVEISRPRDALRDQGWFFNVFVFCLVKTATKGDVKHSVLFDTGPEEEAWERNVKRLRADLSRVELIQLSHWHRDHSGLFPRTVHYFHVWKEQLTC